MENVLVTGGNGFLGIHLVKELKRHYNVLTLGRKLSDYNIDLSIEVPNFRKNISIVVHAAGKAHSTPKSKKEIQEFFDINFMGTKRLLNGLKANIDGLKTFIFISTVAVYGVDSGEFIDEKHPLKGVTPYALSKIKAEELLIDFGNKNNINVVILRLPLVTGKNPVGNLNSIIKAIQKGYYFRIGKGQAKKSIVSAYDIANIIPELFDLNGVYNLTDTSHPMISEIDSVIAYKLNKKIKSIPIFFIKILAKIGDIFSFIPFNSLKYKKLTKNLTYSNKKLFNDIKYRPSKGLSDIVKNLNN